MKNLSYRTIDLPLRELHIGYLETTQWPLKNYTLAI